MKIKVFLVFLHEDGFGPEWDYLKGVFTSRYRAHKYIKFNPIFDLGYFKRGKWSYRIETRTLNEWESE